MNKDQRLLEEAYQSIYENAKEPLYFGPPERKQEFLDLLKTFNYKVNEDGSVSVNGDVIFEHIPLHDRIPFNFKEVAGNFNCNFCELTSLEGSPKTVGGHFLCHENKLETLEGGPEIVKGTVNCTSNDLKTLVGSPKHVGGYFMCYSNRDIDSIKGAPETIGMTFDCDQFSDEDYRKYAKTF